MTNTEILNVTIYFFLSISILVVLHELGHFLTARYFGCRVEKFYLFFDPWFSLFKKKIGDTEYGIGWLPLGGYVKISGMVDESMDKEAMKLPPKDYEFRSKPAWQRLIIMLGGIIVNVLLGIFIFSMLLWKFGDQKIAPQNYKFGMYFSNTLQKTGFQNGDIITKINGQSMKDLGEWPAKMIFGKGDSSTVDVIRNGKDAKVIVNLQTIRQIQAEKETPHIEPQIPFVVEDVDSTRDAFGKLQKGDTIVGVNGYPLEYFQIIRDTLANHKNQMVSLDVHTIHGLDTIDVRLDSAGKLGVYADNNFNDFFKIDSTNYSFFGSFGAGAQKAWQTLTGQAKGFYAMAADNKVSAKDNVGGFMSIAKLFPHTWGEWPTFWRMTALLSLVLAFMNLLPIPALDGGHVVFLLYEIISGKPPSQKFMEVAQVVGMILVLGLILFINGREIIQSVFG